MTRASLAKQPRDVARMFDAVARRYDRTNTVLSFGQDRRWRRQTRRSLHLRPGQRVLDLAAGTGVSTVELARAHVTAVACDFSLGMLRAGRSDPRRRDRVPFVAGDATALPFADAVFDAAVISFGLRNVVDVPRALAEMARVVRPGGHLVVCEFSRPTWQPFRVLYLNYLMRALPAVARRVSSNAEAYVYLAESIRAWPDQQSLEATLVRAGWTGVRHRNLSGGIVALHSGLRAGAPAAVSGVPAGVSPSRPRQGWRGRPVRAAAVGASDAEVLMDDDTDVLTGGDGGADGGAGFGGDGGADGGTGDGGADGAAMPGPEGPADGGAEGGTGDGGADGPAMPGPEGPADGGAGFGGDGGADGGTGDGGADGPAMPGPEGPADGGAGFGDGGADGGTGDGGADGPAMPGPEGPADGGAEGGTGDGGADGPAMPGPEGPADGGA